MGLLYNTSTMTTSIKAKPAGKPESEGSSARFDVLLVAAFCVILFFVKLGSYPLFDLDEPRYAESAREMLERGNWITPYFNYEVRFEKPVFFYWLIMLAYKTFGLSEFSARFFSAVSASAIVGMTYAFGRHLVSRQYGLFSALILATSIMMIGLSRMAITDMTLSCFMTGTTLCLFLAAHRDLRKWWLMAGLVTGFGILTKGPVALMVPGAIFALYTLAIGQFKRCILNRWTLLATLLAIAIAAPWYLAIYQENGPIFIESQLMNNVTRYADVVSGHKQPAWFYTLVLIVGFLPWTPYLPASLRQLWQTFKSGHRQQVEQQNFHYLLPLFSLVWIVFVFFFFSVSSTKLLTYILPLFPALALLTASVWDRCASQTGTSADIGKWMSVPAWILPIGTLIAGTVFITNMDKLLPREAAGIEANAYNFIAVALLLIGTTLSAWLLRRRQAANALKAQAFTMALLVLVAMQGIVPNISKAAQGVMMRYLGETHGQPLMLYEIQRTSLTFYGKRRIARYVEEQRPEILTELNKNPQTYVITKTDYLDQFVSLIPDPFQLTVLEKGPVYSFLSVRKKP